MTHPTTAWRQGTEQLSAILLDLGAVRMFGVMGDGNLDLIDSFVQHGGSYIAAANESGATLMAYGQAEATGETGVATVTHGPGLTHAITALAESAKSQASLLLICGGLLDSRHPQHLGQRALVEAVGVEFRTSSNPSRFADAGAAAFESARKRPVVLELVRSISPCGPTAAARPDDRSDLAATWVRECERPLIVAGRGAEPFMEAVSTLADQLGAPIGTTLRAHGLFEDYERHIGIVGHLATPLTTAFIDAADTIIAVGASLNRYTTTNGRLIKDKTLVKIAGASTVESQGARRSLEVELQDLITSLRSDARRPAWQPPVPPTPYERRARTPPGRAGTVDLAVALQELLLDLPANHVYVCDGGRFMVQALSHIRSSGPRNFVYPQAFASIGTAIAAAVGAAVARPQDLIVVICGDGGLMHSGLTELATAARLGLRLTVIVCNDGGYGAEYVQLRSRGGRAELALIDWPDLEGVSRALGAEAVKVDSEEGLTIAREAIAVCEGTLLIDVRIDPDAVPAMP